MLGVIFATFEEARAFLEKINANKIRDNIYLATHKEKKIYIAISGMGEKNAQSISETLIAEYKIKVLINAGAAGSLKRNAGLFDCYTVRRLISRNKIFDLSPIPDMKEATLITVDEGVFDTEKKELLSKSGDIVDMEGGGIAESCIKNGIFLSNASQILLIRVRGED